MFRLRLEARRTALEAYTSPTESSPISDNPVLELRFLLRRRRQGPDRVGQGNPRSMTLLSSSRVYTPAGS